MESNYRFSSNDEFSPGIFHQKSLQNSNRMPTPSSQSLPLVFFPSSRQKNLWNEIAYTILRSIHSEDSFAKTSRLNFRKNKLLEFHAFQNPPILDSSMQLKTFLETKNEDKFYKKEDQFYDNMSHISPKSHKSNILTVFPQENQTKHQKTKKIQYRARSFSLGKNDKYQMDKITPLYLGRRKSCHGNAFGFPTRFQISADTNIRFQTQMEKKREIPALVFGYLKFL